VHFDEIATKEDYRPAMTTDPRTAEPTDRGASRGDLRRKAFLKASREVFVEQGYEAASMSDIVQRAGGSLSTLYAQFGDKQGLFLAMIDDRVKDMTATMSVELSSHSPVEVGLRRIGRQFASKLLEPESLEIYRLLMGMARKFPDIPREFFRRGPERMRAELAAYLTDRAEAGEIEIDDAERTAMMFLEIARAGLVNRALMDSSIKPDQQQIDDSIDLAVQCFLHGIVRMKVPESGH
jgi:AcrR family transcriptional regulator